MAVTVADLKATLGFDYSNFEQGVKSATNLFTNFSGKIEQVGKKLTLGVTLPLAASAAGAVTAASAFDSSMSKIEGLVGATADEMGTMRTAALNLAGATAKAPNELAEALFSLKSAGLDSTESVQALELAAKASAAGLGETQAVALTTASAMTAYAAEGLTAAQATDILVATVREGNLSAEDLASSLSAILPIASAAGVSLDEVGASVAIITRSGASASEAVTGLRAAVLAMNAPTGEATKLLEAAGLSAGELRKTLADDGVIAALRAVEQAADGDASAMRLMLGSTEALNAATVLLSTDAQTLSTVFDGVANSTGDLDKAFAVASDTTEFKFKAAMQEMQATAIKFGEMLLPVAKKILDFVNTLLDLGNTLLHAFGAISEPIKKMAIAFGAVAAAAGPFLIVLGKMGKMLGNAQLAFSATSVAIAGMEKAGLGDKIPTQLTSLNKGLDRTTSVLTKVTLGFGALMGGLAVAGVAIMATKLVIDKLSEAKNAANDRAKSLSGAIIDLTADFDEAAAAAVQTTDVFKAAAEGMDKVGVTADDLVTIAKTGTDAFDDLGDSLGASNRALTEGEDPRTTAVRQLGELAAAHGGAETAIGAEVLQMRDWVLYGQLTVEEARAMINAQDETADAFDDTRESMQANAEMLVTEIGLTSLAAKAAEGMNAVIDAGTLSAMERTGALETETEALSEAALAEQMVTDATLAGLGVQDVAVMGHLETADAVQSEMDAMIALAISHVEAATTAQGVVAILSALEQGLVFTEDRALAYAAAEDMAAQGAETWDAASLGVVSSVEAAAIAAARAEDAAEALARAEETAAAQAEILAAKHEGLVEAIGSATAELAQSIDSFVDVGDAFNRAAEAATDSGKKMTLQAWIDEMNRTNQAAEEWAANLAFIAESGSEAFVQKLTEMGPEAAKEVKLVADHLRSGGSLNEIEAAFEESGAMSNKLLNGELALIRDAMITTMASAILEAAILGQNIAASLASGIDRGGYLAVQAAARLATSLIESGATELQALSPSRVFIAMGEDVAAGMAIGIDNGAPAAAAAAVAMAAEIVDSASVGFEGGFAAISEMAAGLGEEAVKALKDALAQADLENEFQAIADGLAEAAQDVADAFDVMVDANARVREAQSAYDKALVESMHTTKEERLAILDAEAAHRQAQQAMSDLDYELRVLTFGTRDLTDLTLQSAQAQHDAKASIIASKDAVNALTWEIDQLNNGQREMTDLTLESAMGQAQAALNLYNAEQAVADLTAEHAKLTAAGKDATGVQLKLDLATLKVEEAMRRVALAEFEAMTVGEQLARLGFELEGSQLAAEAATRAYGEALREGKTVEEAMTAAIQARDIALLEEQLAQEAVTKAVEDAEGPTDDLIRAEEELARANEEAAQAEEDHRTKIGELMDRQVVAQEEMVRLIAKMAEVDEAHGASGQAAVDSGGEQEQAWVDAKDGISTTIDTMKTVVGNGVNAVAEAVRSGTENAKLSATGAFDGMVANMGTAMERAKTNTSTWVSSINALTAQIVQARTVTITTRTVDEVARNPSTGIGAGDAGSLAPGAITPGPRGNRPGRNSNGGFGGVTDSTGDLILMPGGGVMPAVGPILSDGKHRLAGIIPGEVVVNPETGGGLSELARELGGRPANTRGRSGSGGGDTYVTFNVSAGVIASPQQVRDLVRDIIRDEQRINPGSLVGVG